MWEISSTDIKQTFNTLGFENQSHYFWNGVFKWDLLDKNRGIFVQISLIFFPVGPTDNKSALVMAWHRTGDKPLPEPMAPLCFYVWNRPSDDITLKPRQNCRHFVDDILKCIFLNENVWISLKISLKFKVRINNIAALARITTCRRQSAKPLCEKNDGILTQICVNRLQWNTGVNMFFIVSS